MLWWSESRGRGLSWRETKKKIARAAVRGRRRRCAVTRRGKAKYLLYGIEVQKILGGIRRRGSVGSRPGGACGYATSLLAVGLSWCVPGVAIKVAIWWRMKQERCENKVGIIIAISSIITHDFLGRITAGVERGIWLGGGGSGGGVSDGGVAVQAYLCKSQAHLAAGCALLRLYRACCSASTGKISSLAGPIRIPCLPSATQKPCCE